MELGELLAVQNKISDSDHKYSMWNNFSDVEGECNAHCYIGDNYGDGSATFRRTLPKGHRDLHIKKFRENTCKLSQDDEKRGIDIRHWM